MHVRARPDTICNSCHLDYKRTWETTVYKEPAICNSPLTYTQEQYRQRGGKILHFGNINLFNSLCVLAYFHTSCICTYPHHSVQLTRSLTLKNCTDYTSAGANAPWWDGESICSHSDVALCKHFFFAPVPCPNEWNQLVTSQVKRKGRKVNKRYVWLTCCIVDYSKISESKNIVCRFQCMPKGHPVLWNIVL
jgi:hypothetical protein